MNTDFFLHNKQTKKTGCTGINNTQFCCILLLSLILEPTQRRNKNNTQYWKATDFLINFGRHHHIGMVSVEMFQLDRGFSLTLVYCCWLQDSGKQLEEAFVDFIFYFLFFLNVFAGLFQGQSSNKNADFLLRPQLKLELGITIDYFSLFSLELWNFIRMINDFQF